MAKFLRRAGGLRLPAGIHPLLLLAVAVLAYGLVIPWLGFYWDDYPMSWIANQFGPQGLARYFSTNRPVWGLLYEITTPLFGQNLLAWQLLALFWRWASAAAFWLLLRAVWPSHPQAAAWGSLLFLVYPGFMQQAIALLYSHFFIVLTIFIFSLWLSVKAARLGRRGWALHLLALLLSAYHLLAMEYFFLIELLRPLLIYLALTDQQPERRLRLRRTLQSAWPYLALFAGVMVWRLFFFNYQTENYELSFFQDLGEQPLQAILALLWSILQSLWVTIVAAWASVFALPDVQTAGMRTILLGVLVVLAAAALLAGAFYLARRDLNMLAQRPPWVKPALLLGLLACLAGGGSIWLIGIVPQLAFAMDRFTLPFLFGASLLVAGLLAALPGRAWLRWGLLVLLVSLAAGKHFTVANDYRRAWVAQERFFWQMAWRMPALEPGTIVMMNQPGALDYYTDNSLTAPLNWIYASENTSQEMSLLLLYPERRLGGSLSSLTSGLPIDVDYLAAAFHGSTSQVVAVYYEPPACLRVLNPNLDTESPLLSVMMQQAAVLSDPQYILPDPPAGSQRILPDFYGAEPAHGWCYYFEKADLARQQGDWEQVVALGEQAFALGDYPNDPLERVPFIEGYAHTGAWQQAQEQTRLAQIVSPEMSVPLCLVWGRLAEATQPSSDRDVVIAALYAELGCNP